MDTKLPENIRVLLTANRSKYVTPIQFQCIWDNIEGEISDLEKQKNLIIKSQSVPFQERVNQLCPIDSRISNLQLELITLKEEKV